MKNLKINFLVILLLLALTHKTKSQDRRADFNYWTIGVNGGASLLWGDMADSENNPFKRYFTKDQGYIGRLDIGRKITPFLGASLGGNYGTITGYRDTWSTGDPADLYFKTMYGEASLNLEVDLLNIIKPKPRMINFYMRGGVGMAFYNAEKMKQSTGTIVNSVSSNALIIPWGWGIRFDPNDRIGISFENTFKHAMSDDIDAHDSKWTDVNDIVSYTSVGVHYRIFPRDKKPSIEEPPVETIDSVIAAEEKLEPLEIFVSGDGKLYPGEEYTVNVEINKDKRKEKSRLQFSIPLDFEAIEIESGGADFKFVDHICSYTWDKFPEKETINVSFKLKISETAEVKSHKIAGILFYNENGEEKIKQININIKVENPPVAENKVDEKPKEVEKTPNEDVKIEKAEKTVPNSDLVYRVQVRAIYGGKSSPVAVADMYNLKEEVIEDYDNGYMKYLAGEFATYEEAQAYKQKLRQGKVKGAFVVAYHKGQRVKDIQQAIDMQSNITSPPEANIQTENEKGVVFRIQIAATNKYFTPGQAADLYNLNDKVKLIPHNGLNKYLVGDFKAYNKAKDKLEEIKTNVPGAFIVKYVNGIRQ